MVPNLIFLYELVRLDVAIPTNTFFPGYYITPSIVWLGVVDGYPSYNNMRLTLISFETHDSVPKIVNFLFTWIVVTLLQVLYLLIYLAWLVMITPTIILFWLLLGIFFFQTKLLSIGAVWNFWVSFWIGRNEFDRRMLTKRNDALDYDIFNKSLLAEFLFETVPQLIVQSINSKLTGTLTNIAIFSITLSSYSVLNGVYKYGYHVLWLGKNIADVPQSIPYVTDSSIVNNNISKKENEVYNLNPMIELQAYRVNEGELESFRIKEVLGFRILEEGPPEFEAWRYLMLCENLDVIRIIVNNDIKNAFDLRNSTNEIKKKILEQYKKVATSQDYELVLTLLGD